MIDSHGRNNAKCIKENMTQMTIHTIYNVFYTTLGKYNKTIVLEKKNYFNSETAGQIYNLLPPDGSEHQVQIPTTVHHFNRLISQVCASFKWGNRTIKVLECPKCLI